MEVLPAGFLSQRFAARRNPKEKEMEGKGRERGWKVYNESIEAINK